MKTLAFFLALQVIPQLRTPEPEIKTLEGPLLFREDLGQTTKAILRNGLTVILQERGATPLTSIVTWVKAGYFDEVDRVTGIAHVIEHMFFKGTQRRPVGEIARETKALGGYLNAHTFYDRTVYVTVVPAENAKKALDIQSDALWNSAFDAAELKREIEVVLQENSRKLDNPSAVAAEKLYATAYQSHRMRRWRIGATEGLRALTRDDLVTFYKKFYQPSNIILSIAGSFNREDMLKEVIRVYGPVEDVAIEPDPSPVEPPQSEFRYSWQRGSTEQPRVSLGYHVPGALSKDASALEVLAAILSQGRASRLNRFVRDEKGAISAGSAHHLVFKDIGYFGVHLETDTPIDAAIASLAEIENIKKFGVSAETLARARTLLAGAFFRRLETLDGAAEELAGQEALGSWKRHTQYIDDLRRVTADDVSRVARTFLTAANLTVFEYLPTAETRMLSDSEYRGAVLDRVAAVVEERSEEDLPFSGDIPGLPEGLAVDIVRPASRHAILRGPEVYVREDHRLPLVSFGVFYPGGRLFETSENAGITELMLRAALRGSQRYNSADISRRLENAGAQIQVVNEPDFFGYLLEGLAGKLDAALEVLVDVLQTPEFAEDQIDLERNLQLSRIKTLRDNNVQYPLQLFMKNLYGEHPYARPANGEERTVRQLTSADLNAWFREHQRTVAPSIVVVGDSKGTGLVASIADAITNEDLNKVEIGRLSPPEIKKEAAELVEVAPRQQTALVYGFEGASFTNGDRYPLLLLSNIVSGLGGRFFDAIREKQGLAYTVMAGSTSYARSGSFITYTAFSPENEARVREALGLEFERLRRDGVTFDEVRKSISYTVGEQAIALQSRTALALEYARAAYSGIGLRIVDEFAASIRSLNVDQIKKVIEKYLNPAGLKVAVVRGGK